VFLTDKANRSGPCSSCIYFWAIDIVEKAEKAEKVIAAATDFIAFIFISPSGGGSYRNYVDHPTEARSETDDAGLLSPVAGDG
jgi:hypothetical protein